MKVSLSLNLNQDLPDLASLSCTVISPNLSFDYYKIKPIRVPLKSVLKNTDFESGYLITDRENNITPVQADDSRVTSATLVGIWCTNPSI